MSHLMRLWHFSSTFTGFILDLHLSISNGFVSSKIYDKRDDFDFDIVNFPFLDGDVPRSTSYGVYISQLIRFARVSSHVVDFNGRNKSKLILQSRMRSHPVALDIWFLAGLFVYFHTSCARTAKALARLRGMRRPAWAFAGRLRDQYHNLMSWFSWSVNRLRSKRGKANPHHTMTKYLQFSKTNTIIYDMRMRFTD